MKKTTNPVSLSENRISFLSSVIKVFYKNDRLHYRLI